MSTASAVDRDSELADELASFVGVVESKDPRAFPSSAMLSVVTTVTTFLFIRRSPSGRRGVISRANRDAKLRAIRDARADFPCSSATVRARECSQCARECSFVRFYAAGAGVVQDRINQYQHRINPRIFIIHLKRRSLTTDAALKTWPDVLSASAREISECTV